MKNSHKMRNNNARTPRFKRKPGLIGGFIIQNRDVEIIRLAYEYGLINSEQVCALVHGSDQGILRRLMKLYHHGYLDRPVSQVIFSNPILGPQKMVYALGDRGADILSERLGIDCGKKKWSKKNGQLRERHIQHTLLISQFRACLTLAMNKTTGARLVLWVRENTKELRDHVNYATGDKRRRLTIIPDGFFGIEDTRGLMYFFIEADRSTMSHRRFKDKILAYRQWWRQGGARKRFGIENFRVLTLTVSQKRRDNLVKTAQRVVEKGGYYMFWFCCINEIDLAKPESVLEEIWTTAGQTDVKRHSIME